MDVFSNIELEKNHINKNKENEGEKRIKTKRITSQIQINFSFLKIEKCWVCFHRILNEKQHFTEIVNIL